MLGREATLTGPYSLQEICIFFLLLFPLSWPFYKTNPDIFMSESCEDVELVAF